MANPWFRLYSEFAHDPKIQMLSEAMQRRYVMLLCLRCSEVLETLHETEIAFQLRLTTSELEETKQLFISKNFIDKQWNLTNWDKRQFVSDSSTMRVARHREKKKQVSNVDETLQKRQSNALDTDTDKKQNIDAYASLSSTELPDCPHKEILILYKKHLSNLSQPRVWEGSRQANLRQRWKQAAKSSNYSPEGYKTLESGLKWWDSFFAYIANDTKLATGFQTKDRTWLPDLEWIVNATNFAKIIDGKYAK
jgi:hypothetical protein